MYFTTRKIVFHKRYVVIINMENMMEIENIKVEGFDLNATDEVRAKTSLKMHYEAQSAVIERQLGGLEGVRSKLGLSQRKMAQLLMVDPSAWTRWNRSGTRAPGIVWRALQWYMILQEKIPGLTPNYFLGTSPEYFKAEAFKEIRKDREVLGQKLSEFESKIRDFKAENDDLLLKIFNLEKKVAMWRVGTIIMTMTMIFSAFVWILWARRGF